MVSKGIPQTVRFALICLGIFASIQLLAGLGMAEFPLVVSALLTAGLMWALASRRKWAYVATFLFIGVAVAALLFQDQPLAAGGLFAANALVWVPLAMAKEWYFPARRRYGPV